MHCTAFITFCAYFFGVPLQEASSFECSETQVNGSTNSFEDSCLDMFGCVCITISFGRKCLGGSVTQCLFSILFLARIERVVSDVVLRLSTVVVFKQAHATRNSALP